MNQFSSASHPEFYIASVQPSYRFVDSPEATPSSSGDFPTTTMGFMVVIGGLLLFLYNRNREKDPVVSPPLSNQPKAWSPQHLLQLPCSRCKYFQANRYLPCAVNPTQALTVEANNCRDFEAKETKQSSE
ncbi:MAG: hypothetical protein HC922_06250 [Leptolyngbyaceae cyanobacterium SM2_3_12]|nr:hypothetical protein [Leptolyngbyaceae cyanobacterium SM2_3_12]